LHFCLCVVFFILHHQTANPQLIHIFMTMNQYELKTVFSVLFSHLCLLFYSFFKSECSTQLNSTQLNPNAQTSTILVSSFDRPEIFYSVIFKEQQRSVYAHMLKFLISVGVKKRPEQGSVCGIVYCHKRDSCDEVSFSSFLNLSV
jgi:superfamily II DNA helicase RecQ